MVEQSPSTVIHFFLLASFVWVESRGLVSDFAYSQLKQTPGDVGECCI